MKIQVFEIKQGSFYPTKSTSMRKNNTGSVRGVLMNQGATQLVLILSFAHSHAKFLVSWFIAAAKRIKEFNSVGHISNSF